MTYQFFKTMMRFCFPEKDPETLDGDGDNAESSTLSRKGGKHFSGVNKTKRGKESSFYVPIEDKDDVEKMKVWFPFSTYSETDIVYFFNSGKSRKE